MAIDWSLGAPRADAGTQFQQGYQNALLMQEHRQDRALQQQQLENQQTQQKQTQGFQLTERHRADIRLGARIVRQMNPTDEATWQRARAAAVQAGIDVSEVPPHFDPNYVQQLLSAGQQLDSMEGGYTLDEGAVRYDGGNNVVARGGPPRPRYYPVPPGGRLELDPSYQGATTDAAPAPQRHTATNPQTGERIEYNEQTGQWQPVTDEAPAFHPGGPASAPGNFPR